MVHMKHKRICKHLQTQSILHPSNDFAQFVAGWKVTLEPGGNAFSHKAQYSNMDRFLGQQIHKQSNHSMYNFTMLCAQYLQSDSIVYPG